MQATQDTGPIPAAIPAGEPMFAIAQNVWPHPAKTAWGRHERDTRLDGLRSAKGNLRLSRGRVRLRHGYGDCRAVSALAVACVQKKSRRVLIVAGDDDPAGARALRDALTMMLLVGIPSDFKLALVATSERVAVTYRNAQRDLCAAGATTRLFDNEQNATRWLEGADVSTQGTQLGGEGDRS